MFNWNKKNYANKLPSAKKKTQKLEEGVTSSFEQTQQKSMWLHTDTRYGKNRYSSVFLLPKTVLVYPTP